MILKYKYIGNSFDRAFVSVNECFAKIKVSCTILSKLVKFYLFRHYNAKIFVRSTIQFML
jgi:hypothetical protein